MRRATAGLVAGVLLLTAPAAHASGQLDEGFGMGGTSSVQPQQASDVAVDADGSSWVASSDSGTGQDAGPGDAVTVTRFDAAGRRMASFGTDGQAVVDVDPGRDGSSVLAPRVRPAAGGGVLLVATSIEGTTTPTERATVTRLDAAGRIDASYGVDGTAPLPGTRSAAAAVTTAPDGSATIAYDAGTGASPTSVARLDPRGRLDARWGTAGVARLTPPSGASSIAPVGMVPARGGGVTLDVQVWRGGNDYSTELIALGATGHLDMAFGTSGRTDVGTVLPDPLLRDADGALFLPDGGFVGTGAKVIAFTADGRPRSDGYGDAGVAPVVAPPGAMVAPYRVLTEAIQPGGEVLAAFVTDPAGPFRGGLLRLTRAGKPDPTFGDHGVALLDDVPGGTPASFPRGLAYAPEVHRVLIARQHEDDPGSTRWDLVALRGDEPPVASLRSPVTATAGIPVALDASPSTDPDPDGALRFAWDLDGDGAFDDAAGVRPVVTPSRAGTSVVAVRVTDAEGLSAIARASLVVRPAPPTSAMTTTTTSVPTASVATTTLPGTTGAVPPAVVQPGVTPPVARPEPEPTSPSGSDRPRARLTSTRLALDRRGRVRLRLACPAGTARCTGRVELRLGTAVAGSADYVIAAGRRATVRLTVKPARRSRVVRRAARPSVVLTPTGGTAARAVRVTVSRPPGPRR